MKDGAASDVVGRGVQTELTKVGVTTEMAGPMSRYDGMLNGEVLPPRLTDTGLASGSYQFSFSGASGLTYSVWASTNLLTWTYLGPASEVSHGWFFYQDPSSTNSERCFYQVRYP